MKNAFEIYSDTGFVRRYARQIAGIDNPVFYERRATLELLPTLAKQRILDAGCGPGVYSQWLAAQGAEVTALDYSQAMLEQLRPLSKKIQLLKADLAEPLPLPDNSFELVLCAMVLQHLRDWAPVLTEFRRVLAPGGRIVLSTTHPLADLMPETDYFTISQTAEEWAGYGIEMPCYRRSFASIWADIQAAGLQVDALVEPRSPGTDPFIIRQPWVLCLRLKIPN